LYPEKVWAQPYFVAVVSNPIEEVVEVVVVELVVLGSD